eukprot:616728-Pelagomonas_calceolata.AAC.2
MPRLVRACEKVPPTARETCLLGANPSLHTLLNTIAVPSTSPAGLDAEAGCFGLAPDHCCCDLCCFWYLDLRCLLSHERMAGRIRGCCCASEVMGRTRSQTPAADGSGHDLAGAGAGAAACAVQRQH